MKSWLKPRKAKLVEKTKMLERSWDKFVGGLGYWTNLLRGRGSATLTRAHVRNHGNHPGGC